MEGLEAQALELEIILSVGLFQNAATYCHVTEHVASVLFAVADVVDGLDRLQAKQLLLHDPIELRAGAGEIGSSCHTYQPLLELAGCRHLATGEGVQDAGFVMGEVDAEVVPGLVRHFIALEVQRLRVAVGDFHHRTTLAQGLVAPLLVIE
ncbi:hypothetical protein D9M71_666750 [compost metagenome]